MTDSEYWEYRYGDEGVERAAANALKDESRKTHEATLLVGTLNASVVRDGNQWCVLFGDNLQSGIAGFGDSPQEATVDFHKSWNEKIESK